MIRFPGGGWLEIDAAPSRKVAFADPPTLHLPPVEFRRRVSDCWGFDVAGFFPVKDPDGNGRGYQPSLKHGEHWPANESLSEKRIVVRENRRVGRGRESVQSISGFMHDPCRIDSHLNQEDRAMRRKTLCIFKNIFEWKFIVPFQFDPVRQRCEFSAHFLGPKPLDWRGAIYNCDGFCE